ncbi:MAG: hypothetical protein HY595_03525 [Candidatus Omnitrophica bacterium]|nr:hypothetical protein [Candidatus Omnitrophota bacterium]
MSRLSKSLSVRLFLVSFVTLFLELALIRWVSTEIRIFAYVNNLVLLACFLGMGLGCSMACREASFSLTNLCLALLIGVVTTPLVVPLHGVPRHLVRDTPLLLSAFSDFVIWQPHATSHVLMDVTIGLGSVLLIFGVILIAFVPLGRVTGGLLEACPNRVVAYSLNIASSLAGIWAFNAASMLWLPPWMWFLVVVAGLALLITPTTTQRISLGVLVFAVGAFAFTFRRAPTTIIWSPYQKLEVVPTRAGTNRAYTVSVNNVGYMNLLDLSRRGIQGLPIFVNPLRRAFSQYDLPYRFLGRLPNDVLIVGAGGGNDAAGALRHGARHVTAVEIDPGIARLGQRLHPEAPYADPRVSVIIADARAVFKRASARYDVVAFGLLDAHTQASSYHNTRLDHYVYTEESFHEAKRLLTDDGVLTVIFEVERPFIAARLGGLLQRVFGEEPIACSVRSEGWFGPGGVMFVMSRDMARLRQAIQRDPDLTQFIERHQVQWQRPVKLTTDDWPYLYLERQRIPTLHLCVSGILLLLLVMARRVFIPAGRTMNRHFFFLGAAFLLLEFQNISKTALVFGSTWIVNAITMSAILLLILAANGIAARWRLRPGWMYGGLFLSIALVALTPLRLLNTLPEIGRVVLAGGLLNLPVLFAGMIFINSFQRTPTPASAFGSNLLGAVVGGLLESLSFITGIRMLLGLVAGLYALAFVCRHRL